MAHITLYRKKLNSDDGWKILDSTKGPQNRVTKTVVLGVIEDGDKKENLCEEIYEDILETIEEKDKGLLIDITGKRNMPIAFCFRGSLIAHNESIQKQYEQLAAHLKTFNRVERLHLYHQLLMHQLYNAPLDFHTIDQLGNINARLRSSFTNFVFRYALLESICDTEESDTLQKQYFSALPGSVLLDLLCESIESINGQKKNLKTLHAFESEFQTHDRNLIIELVKDELTRRVYHGDIKIF